MRQWNISPISPIAGPVGRPSPPLISNPHQRRRRGAVTSGPGCSIRSSRESEHMSPPPASPAQQLPRGHGDPPPRPPLPHPPRRASCRRRGGPAVLVRRWERHGLVALPQRLRKRGGAAAQRHGEPGLRRGLAAWLSFNEPTDTLMPGQAIRGGNGTTTLHQRPLHAGQLRHAAARGRRRPLVRQHQQRQRSARPHRQRQARPQRRDPRSSSPPTRAPPSGCGGSRSTTTATCSSTPWCPGPGGGAWCGSSCRTAGALMQRSSL